MFLARSDEVPGRLSPHGKRSSQELVVWFATGGATFMKYVPVIDRDKPWQAAEIKWKPGSCH